MGWRIFLRLFATFSLIICAQTVVANCMSYNISRDVIFIHGIGSSSKAFGSFDKFIQEQYPNECIRTLFFEYDTGNNNLDISDFTKEFNTFFYQKILNQDQSLDSNRHVSIISHSQGGLIFLNWVIDSFNFNNNINKSYIYRIDTITTASTPFFGAAIANVALNLKLFWFDLFGKKELEQMSFGSLFNYKIYSNLSSNESLLAFLKNVKFLDIGGVIPQNEHLKAILNTKSLEGDSAVGPSSSNINMIHYKEVVPKNHVLVSDFKELDVTTFFPVNAVHGRVKLFGVNGVAHISKKCLESDCELPITKLYKDKIINSSQNENYDFIEKNLSAFRVVIYLKTISRKNIKLHLNSLSDNVNINHLDFYKKFNKISKDLYSISFSGALKGYENRKDGVMNISLSSGKSVKEISLPVSVSRTTNIEISL